MSDTTLSIEETLELTEELTTKLEEEREMIRKCDFNALKESRGIREALSEQYFSAIHLLQLQPELIEQCSPTLRETVKNATITLSEAMEAHKLALKSQIRAHEHFLDLCAKATQNKVATTYTPRGKQAFQKDAAVFSQSTYAINAQF